MASCGSEEAIPEVPVEDQPTDSGDPLSEIPAEELYGASPVENIWSPLFEITVPGLPAGWDGARLALISDLQLGLWEQNETVATAAVQHASERNPDVILLLGDYLAVGDDTSPLVRVLAPLQGRNAIAVLGDRDVRSDSIAERISSTLRNAGVQVLSNNSINLQRNGDFLPFAGLDPEIVARGWEEQRYILATLTDPESTPVLMMHQPPLVTRSSQGRYPVVVAGGTFCGDIEVPGTPRLSWLREEALPNGGVEGLDRVFQVLGSTVVVTCGVGYGFVPLRFGAAPEVPILTLRAAGGVAAPDSIVPDTLLERFQRQSTDTAGGN